MRSRLAFLSAVICMFVVTGCCTLEPLERVSFDAARDVPLVFLSGSADDVLKAAARQRTDPKSAQFVESDQGILLRLPAHTENRREIWSLLHGLARKRLIALPVDRAATSTPPPNGDWAQEKMQLSCPTCGERRTWGAGQTLCQLDTGFKPNAFFENRNVRMVPEFNFVDPSVKTPEDTGRSGRGFIAAVTDLHYHGTGAASVAVASSAEFQGIAPGATYVPLRISDGFVGFAGYRLTFLTGNDPKQMAKGLHAVAQRGRAVGETCDVSSIAQGAILPYRDIWDGLNDALDAGVIVVAAAGQIPSPHRLSSFLRPRVAFPARYSSTGIPIVAANAIQPDGSAWPAAFRGPAADVAAPGTFIRHVAYVAQSNPARFELKNTGEGTTFATGITAGAALLWLQVHGGKEAVIKHYSDESGIVAPRVSVPCAFRTTLRKTVQVDRRLRAQGYGHGVINIPALLESELPPWAVVKACIDAFEAAKKDQTHRLKYSSNDRTEWERGGAPAAVATPRTVEEERREDPAIEILKAELEEALDMGCVDKAKFCGATDAKALLSSSTCVSADLTQQMGDASFVSEVRAERCGSRPQTQRSALY